MLQDIGLLESGNILKGLRFPHKIEKVTQIVITAGQLSCLVDFRMWSLKAPAVALFLPGQVVESIDLDEDFSGFGMVMNQEFTDSLNLPVSLQERLFIKDTQFYSVSEEVLDVLSSVYRQVSSLMNQPDNPYREEIIRHLFSAHYYGLGYYMHGLQSQPSTMTAQQERCEKFMSLVAENFKTQRDIGFISFFKEFLNELVLDLLIGADNSGGWIVMISFSYQNSLTVAYTRNFVVLESFTMFAS